MPENNGFPYYPHKFSKELNLLQPGLTNSAHQPPEQIVFHSDSSSAERRCIPTLQIQYGQRFIDEKNFVFAVLSR